MTLPSNDAALLNNDHRRRRWMIRICLSSLFVLLILTVVGFIMFGSSDNDIEQAKAIYAQLNAHRSLSEFERLLGKADAVLSRESLKIWIWRFRKHSLNQIECYNILLFLDDVQGHRHLKCNTEIITGRDAWNFRWYLLKQRLGIQ